MKIMTIVGTRPEIIRLSRVIEKLDKHCTHVLVHIGQNFDKKLSYIFFDELQIRKPDYFLKVKGATFGEQISQILTEMEKILKKHRPDKLLLSGDTNSSLSSIIAKRGGIPVIHMEAGNRCYDDRVPEEVNRRIIDHCSDVLLPYTERNRANLIREGIDGNRIFVTCNPILEVINHYKDNINQSMILDKLAISKGKYFLVTIHRAENVDIESRLRLFITAIISLRNHYDVTVICSLHPHTRDKIRNFNSNVDPSLIQFHEPFGFFDFIRLEQDALCVLSDSGTVQEECCLFHIPTIPIRDVIERLETLEFGRNILSGSNEKSLKTCMAVVLQQESEGYIPEEYTRNNVSDTIIKLFLGYHHTLK